MYNIVVVVDDKEIVKAIEIYIEKEMEGIMWEFILNGLFWISALYGLFEIIKNIIYYYQKR